MKEGNSTMITEILLLGFENLHSLKSLFFIGILLVYGLAVSGNIFIITLVSTCKKLHRPMYIFLTQLSFLDILLITTIVPNMLLIVLNEGISMSLMGCITQFCFFAGLEMAECLLLTMMSYDRYLAICTPLRYTSIMDFALCVKLIVLSWLSNFITILIIALTVCGLKFCGPHVINHFFCDVSPLLDLSCTDTSMVHMEIFIMSVPVLGLPVVVIILSYIYIIITILKIPSITGRQKTFSTCSSHLTVVSIYFGTIIGIYLLPHERSSLATNKVLSLFYTVVTPFVNPIIYSLRNKDIKGIFTKITNKMRVSN
ncbi:olfactory receptor 11L1-like [Spea bombifrons]|uniref:olfactory receptor 11L1-like n=1 Tax=Spea bombifrons TaxID=233779 RepID=UPI00234A05A9|nr:olfactory receptor 11L1-like [Spea bombifrons]